MANDIWQGSRHIERALRPRGAAARLALALGKNQGTVSRWARGTQPDPALWPAIEDALGMERGTLGEPPMSAGAELDAIRYRLATLRVDVEGLQVIVERCCAEVGRLTDVIAELCSALARETL